MVVVFQTKTTCQCQEHQLQVDAIVEVPNNTHGGGAKVVVVVWPGTAVRTARAPPSVKASVV
jgi:hypothetical protein